MYRILTPLLISCLLLGQLDRYFYKSNGSFSLNFITPTWEKFPQTETKKTDISAITHHSFHYLTKGEQSYVFESEDHKWVLKFFRLPKSLRTFCLKKEKNPHSLSKTVNSYKDAYEELSDMTGVVYSHLAPTNFIKKKAEIIDRLHNCYLLDLDSFPFILQKRVSPFFSVFDHLNDKQAKLVISNVIALYLNLYKRGYIDRDPIFDKNLGIEELTPVFMDIGQLEKIDNLPSLKDYLFQMTFSLGNNLKYRSPKLHSYYIKSINLR